MHFCAHYTMYTIAMTVKAEYTTARIRLYALLNFCTNRGVK